jgi:hypothetical protein
MVVPHKNLIDHKIADLKWIIIKVDAPKGRKTLKKCHLQPGEPLKLIKAERESIHRTLNSICAVVPSRNALGENSQALHSIV